MQFIIFKDQKSTVQVDIAGMLNDLCLQSTENSNLQDMVFELKFTTDNIQKIRNKSEIAITLRCLEILGTLL